MRSIKHWTPSYMAARSRVVLYERLNPTHPWLTAQSIELLGQLLRPTDVALEFGSGRSSFWIAERVRSLTSVEHDEPWHRRGIERIAQQGVRNIELLHLALDVPEAEGAKARYVRVLDRFGDQSQDFCLIDGMYRGHCALGVVAKMKPGGVIAIDNAGWFLPSTSTTPAARALEDGPMDEVWQRFLDATATWRRIWTTSGVTDTVLLFKA